MTSSYLSLGHAEQGDFGFFAKPTFLSWLPDETLFSLISRHHYFWGNTLASQTCNQFFNHSRSGSQHDFPSHIGNFVSNTDACFGSVNEVAADRTLLSFYRAFLPSETQGSAVASMAGGSVAHLKLRLGILTSRFRANHPLKSCPVCIDDDRETYGWAYWHMQHQYPGVWICQKHGVFLQESNLKSNGVERFHWHLPALENIHRLQQKTIEALTKDIGPFQNLSRQVIDLVLQGQEQAIDTGRLYSVYSSELKRLGLRTDGGNFRISEIAESYLAHVKPLQALPELSAIASSLSAAKMELTRLLRPPRSGTHPLRHLVLINWLFSSNEDFWNAYVQAPEGWSKAAIATKVRSSSTRATVEDARHYKLVELLKVEGLSISKAARAVDIDVQTAMTWAARVGLMVSRRPKKLAGEVRQLVISKLRAGVDKTMAAEVGRVSVVTITKLLLTEADLHAQWTKARARKSQKIARSAWLRLLKTHTHLGIKIMRELEPASYTWLYRNDRAWLEVHKPERVDKPIGSNAPRILWDARDATLSSKVEHAVLELRRSGKSKRLRLWHLYQAVPELKAKLASLDRLPLTRRAIDNAMSVSAGNSSNHLFE